MSRHAIKTVRCGLTITELVVALAILSALSLLIAQWCGVAAIQQAREQEERVALQLAENAMEQLYAQSWDELTQETSSALAARTVEAEPGYKSIVEITDIPADDSGLHAKRIWLRITHRAKRISLVELMAWRHAKSASTSEDAP
jgi:prepilin-type N-terminal cleavage/methylation domain-containing protein